MSAITRIRLFGSFSAISDHLVRPVVGLVAVEPVGGDAGGDAAQILDQRQAQHDRDGPQLAQLQGGHRLVGGDEAR